MCIEEMRIKWWNAEYSCWQFGYAEYRYSGYEEEYYISFSNSENNETFDILSESDIDAVMLEEGETTKDFIDEIWSDLERMASEAEDNVADVTYFDLT